MDLRQRRRSARRWPGRWRRRRRPGVPRATRRSSACWRASPWRTSRASTSSSRFVEPPAAFLDRRHLQVVVPAGGAGGPGLGLERFGRRPAGRLLRPFGVLGGFEVGVAGLQRLPAGELRTRPGRPGRRRAPRGRRPRPRPRPVRSPTARRRRPRMPAGPGASRAPCRPPPPSAGPPRAPCGPRPGPLRPGCGPRPPSAALPVRLLGRGRGRPDGGAAGVPGAPPVEPVAVRCDDDQIGVGEGDREGLFPRPVDDDGGAEQPGEHRLEARDRAPDARPASGRVPAGAAGSAGAGDRRRCPGRGRCRRCRSSEGGSGRRGRRRRRGRPRPAAPRPGRRRRPTRRPGSIVMRSTTGPSRPSTPSRAADEAGAEVAKGGFQGVGAGASSGGRRRRRPGGPPRPRRRRPRRPPAPPGRTRGPPPAAPRRTPRPRRRPPPRPGGRGGAGRAPGGPRGVTARPRVRAMVPASAASSARASEAAFRAGRLPAGSSSARRSSRVSSMASSSAARGARAALSSSAPARSARSLAASAVSVSTTPASARAASDRSMLRRFSATRAPRPRARASSDSAEATASPSESAGRSASADSDSATSASRRAACSRATVSSAADPLLLVAQGGEALGERGDLPAGQVEPDGLELLGEAAVAAGGVGLALEGLEVPAHLLHQVAEALEVDRRRLQAPLGLLLALAVLEDPGRFLDDGPPVLGAGLEDGVEAALPHDHVLGAAHAGVVQQLGDVEEAAGLAVDGVGGLAVPREAAGDRHFPGGDREVAGGVVEGQRHLGLRRRRPLRACRRR